MRSKPALPLGKGGFREGFNFDKYSKCLRSQGALDEVLKSGDRVSYECAGNVAWINELYAPLPGIPMNYDHVQAIANDVYGSPSKVGNVSLVVAVESDTWDPMRHLGSMRLASPMETLHGLWPWP